MAPRSPTPTFLQAYGQAVRAQRETLGLSQEDLSLKSGLDRTYISGIERGVRNPTLQTMLKIATALGVSPSSLLLRAERLLAKGS